MLHEQSVVGTVQNETRHREIRRGVNRSFCGCCVRDAGSSQSIL